jgi:hypothetical protein
MKTSRGLRTALIASFGAIMQPQIAVALEARVSIGHTAEYTTNTARTEDDEVSEWVHRPSIDIGLRQEGAQLELDADYQYERRIYQKDLFEDEFSLTGRGTLLWHALPERLDFTIRNTRTDSTQRSFTPFTEANRQTVSMTDLGPTLRFRPRSNSELQFEYMYSDVAVTRTDSDSQRHSGTMRYLINLSSVRNVTFSGSQSRVEFDNPFAPKLDVSVGSVTYNQVGSSTELSATGGYNLTRRSQGQSDVKGPQFDATALWNATADAFIEVRASHQITDLSSNLNLGSTVSREGVQEDSDLNAVFKETLASVTLGRPIGNSQISLTVDALRENYEDVPRDNDRLLARLGFARNLNPLTTFTASIETGRRKYDDEDLDVDHVRGSVHFTRQITQRLSGTIGADYDEWDSDGDGRSYQEWTGRASLNYTLLDRR